MRMVANNDVATPRKNRGGNTAGQGFKPGKSGNPSGRPKKTPEQINLEAACRDKTPEALATILAIMADGQEKSRLTAATYVLDRGWGKAPQTINLDATVTMMTPEQRKARIAELLGMI